MEEEDKEEESLTTGVNKEDVFVPKKEDYLLSFSFSTGLRDASYQSNRGPQVGVTEKVVKIDLFRDDQGLVQMSQVYWQQME